MAKREPVGPGSGWVLLSDVAKFLDRNVTLINRDVRPHLAADAVQKFNGRVWIKGQAIINHYVDRAVAKAKTDGNGSDHGKTQAKGTIDQWAQSEAEDKAKITRMKRLELEGRLLPRHQVHGVFMQTAQLFRRFGETLRKRYGRDARELLDDTLDDIQAQVEATISDDHGDDTTTQTAPDTPKRKAPKRKPARKRTKRKSHSG